jgi:hypothetical protein
MLLGWSSVMGGIILPMIAQIGMFWLLAIWIVVSSMPVMFGWAIYNEIVNGDRTLNCKGYQNQSYPDPSTVNPEPSHKLGAVSHRRSVLGKPGGCAPTVSESEAGSNSTKTKPEDVNAPRHLLPNSVNSRKGVHGSVHDWFLYPLWLA